MIDFFSMNGRGLMLPKNRALRLLLWLWLYFNLGVRNASEVNDIEDEYWLAMK
jgi:hypothetical protein